jgi:hypothetical protein
MTSLPAVRPDPPPAAEFTTPPAGPPADFGFVTPAPDIPQRPGDTDAPVPDYPTRPDLLAGAKDPDLLPTQQSLDFAAAPVPTDYAAPPLPAGLTVHHEGPQGAAFTAPPAGPDSPPSSATPSGEATAAGPAGGGSFLWDLAATDVFPVRDDPGTPPPAPGAVSQVDAPGASGG